MCSRLLIRISTPLTALLLTLALGSSSQALAQAANFCPNYANTTAGNTPGSGNGGAFCLNGSDTWFDVMTAAIKAKVAEDKAHACATGGGACVAPHLLQPAGDPAPGESILFYNGTGSGNAANSMKFPAGSAGGAVTGLGTQSIGPMSRNFRPTESCQPGNPNCGATQNGQFPLWQPQIPNVGGLDAAVIITRAQTNRVAEINTPLVPTDSTKANPNNTGLACSFGDPGGGTNCYDQLLQVVLSGTDGSGSSAACADPKRVQAIADLSAAFGTTLRHFYRRDDNSGTTDTWKDKVNVGRFCNGAAIGVLGNNKVHPNLNNQDLDPIRRPCDVSNPGIKEQVACTDLTLATPQPCNANSPNCTQGFITALSENDPGITDITVTIANRIGSDSTGLTIGYAGREGIRLPSGTTLGPTINKNAPSDALVRLDTYLLARRLFIQRGPALPGLDASANEAETDVRASSGACAAPPCLERVKNTGGTNSGLACPDGHPTNKCTGGGNKQRTAEDTLFAWMTDTGGGGSQEGVPGRCNLDPIMKQFGFITCTDDCTNPPSGSSNLCSKTPYPTIPSTPAACIPSNQPTQAGGFGWNYGTFTCAAGTICCSTNAACPGSGICPAATGRPVNSACSANGVQAECAAGLTCTDISGGLLACQ